MQEVGQLVFAYIRLLQAVGGVTEERCSLLPQSLALLSLQPASFSKLDRINIDCPLVCFIDAIARDKQHFAMLHQDIGIQLAKCMPNYCKSQRVW